MSKTYEQMIIENLEDRVTPVNSAVVTSGLPDIGIALNTLNTLISAGIVDQVPMFFNGRDYILYRLSYDYHMRQLEAQRRRSFMYSIAGGRA